MGVVKAQLRVQKQAPSEMHNEESGEHVGKGDGPGDGTGSPTGREQMGLSIEEGQLVSSSCVSPEGGGGGGVRGHPNIHTSK